MSVLVVTTSGFPQSSKNRTRATATEEIAEMAGGMSNPTQIAKAGRAWDSAVEDYNDVSWTFNLVSQSITLVDATSTYTLDSVFRTPKRADLLDSNGVRKQRLRFVKYSLWLDEEEDKSGTGNQPDTYTLQNAHETGLVTFHPIPTATLAYPTARVFYHRWIEKATGPQDRLNVPRDVDEAILQMAKAKFIGLMRSAREGADMMVMAMNKRLMVEKTHRDYKDIDEWPN